MPHKRGIPLFRRLLPVLVIFIGISLVSLALTFAAIDVQSSVRSYVAGEGLWSKAQRDAVFYLQEYAYSGAEQDYARYQEAIAIPLGDRVARLELQKPDYDPAVAAAGFLQGQNHPHDIPGLIRLFRCCAKLPQVAEAVHYWTRGDELVLEIQGIAVELRREWAGAAPVSTRIAALLERLRAANAQVQPLEAAFTQSLGELARWVNFLLFSSIALIMLALLLLGAWVSLRIMRGIRQSEDKYRLLLDTASDAVIVSDPQTGRILEANARAAQLTGRTAERLLGAGTHEIFSVDACVPGGNSVQRDRIFRGDGAVVPVEISCSQSRWEGREARLAIVRDVSERLRFESELRVAANAMEHMAEGVVITDAKRRVVSANLAFTRVSGYALEELVGRRFKQAGLRAEDVRRLRAIWRKVRRDGYWEGELTQRRKSGELYPTLLSVSAVKDPSGAITHYVAVLNDISEYKEYERQLQRLAHHDALTQLLNRAAFEERGAAVLAKARQHADTVALLYIDLDNFKSINDTYGHAAGDVLLRALTERLSEHVRHSDLIARVGGDEFVALLANVESEDAAARVARSLLQSLTLPITVQGYQLVMSASIGLSVFPRGGSEIATLLKTADAAMYQAKKNGKNNLHVFTPEMAREVTTQIAIVDQLKFAIERGELELHYQPCIDLKTGYINSVEALLRWHNAGLGAISPGVFIPLAEENGLIDRITEWVIAEACRQGAHWLAAGLPPLPIAVNVSPRSFGRPDFPERVVQAVAAAGWRNQWLRLEITEHSLMNYKGSAALLQELHEHGIRLAIDDFGVGHSSLNYLKHMPVETLKIDRHFTRNIPDDLSNVAISRAIIGMAKSFKLRVVAEGIEDDATRRFFLEEGCDEGQGYLFSKPQPAAEIEQALRQSAARRITALTAMGIAS
jgi:diguanylate cyclase (GGDEF)-like protein/PAS domain S-box-containing protein